MCEQLAQSHSMELKLPGVLKYKLSILSLMYGVTFTQVAIKQKSERTD